MLLETFSLCFPPILENYQLQCMCVYHSLVIGMNVTSAHCTCLKVEQRVWSTHDLNFDNIGNAALALFAMLTSEGWQE